MIPPRRIVVADDSPFVCQLLRGYLEAEQDFRVVGTANDGASAVAATRRLRPDCLTLDLNMPDMDGLLALEKIMRDYPTPTLIVSGVTRSAAAVTVQALALGAVDFVQKYHADRPTSSTEFQQEFLQKVRLTTQVKVNRLRQAPDSGELDLSASSSQNIVSEPCLSPAEFVRGGVVVIGASTGGPAALRQMLSALPADFPAAVLVVQHLPATFTAVLAEQLDRVTPLPVCEAHSGQPLRGGQVYVAPGDRHLLVQPDSTLKLTCCAPIAGHRPSIDVTMQSAAQAYGPLCRGVLLTGMGLDGVEGLRAIRQHGGTTLAQSAESCVVAGMPTAAVRAGWVDAVGTPEELAGKLAQLRSACF